MVDRAELVQVQQFGQLVGVDTITFVSVFEQSIFSRIAHHQLGHMRLQYVVLFTLLLACQTVGLWITVSRSTVFAGLPRGVWGYFFSMVPGSAFLTTVVLVELLRVVLPKSR